jgi:dUTPase
VDSNALGEIKVMVKALKETVQLHKGQRIAQFLLLPYSQLPNPTLYQKFVDKDLLEVRKSYLKHI